MEAEVKCCERSLTLSLVSVGDKVLQRNGWPPLVHYFPYEIKYWHCFYDDEVKFPDGND